ncbi:MAG: Ig-like domain repeat protein, partial [Rudaea sp.]|uniref:Ig-like domain repeat protein n=1 Tax=Rudaea sp. TaxID=2136325 RepID=UPI001AC9AF69
MVLSRIAHGFASLRNRCIPFLLAVLSLASIVGTTPAFAALAYIPMTSNSKVSVVDTATDTVTATISPLCSSPFGVAVNPAGTRAYFGCQSSNNVAVVDTASNTLITTVSVSAAPVGVVVSPDGSLVYVVSGTGAGTLSVINTATNTVGSTMAIDANPWALTITPDGKRLYIAYQAGASGVAVIDTTSMSKIANVSVGITPNAVVMSPDGTRTYVAAWTSAQVAVINNATNTVTKTIATGPTSYKLAGIVVSPDGSKIYATSYQSKNVAVIDTTSLTVTSTIATGGSAYGIDITPDGKKLYVTNNDASGTVNVVDLSTATPTVSTITLGGAGYFSAVGRFIRPQVQAAQTITGLSASPPTPMFSAGGTFSVSATGGASGNPVTFTSLTTAVCTSGGANGATITMLGAGTCTIQANQAGNSQYSTASPVNLDVAIAKGTQFVTNFVATPPVYVYGGSYTLSATPGASGIPVTFASLTPSVCTVNAAALTVVTAGLCKLTADQAGNANYNAAQTLEYDITMAKADQTITNFAASPAAPVFVSGGTFSVSATRGASSGALVFASSTTSVCTVSATTVTMVAAGICSLTANQAGDANYNAAPTTTLSLNVQPPPPSVTGVNVPPNGLYGIGRTLDFTVQFSSPVTVAGAPRFVLIIPTLGGRYVNYVSGSGTQSLLFRYPFGGGVPNNTSGITLNSSSIDLNGGSLVDANNGAAAVLTLNNVPSLAGIVLDGTAPTVTSIALVGSPPATSRTISYTITFSEPVTGVAAGAFKVETVDGSATGQLGAVTGSGSSYTAVVNNIAGVGHLFLTLNSSGTGIADAAGNAISGGFRLADQFQANVQLLCYVNKAATGANDGTSWTDAYTDLQPAVRSAACAQVWAAKGVYKPGTATTDSFQPRAGQKIYGGFAGVEAALSDRTLSVIATNPTVMSGDIDGNDTTDANGVVLDAAQIAGSNSVNVVKMNNGGAAGYGPDTVIDGFIITAGDASATTGLGGGLRCDASLAQASCGFTLSNLVFSGNRAVGGGALSLTSSAGTANAIVSKVLFRGNRAVGLGGSGGAVSLSAPPAAGRVSPAFSNVVFSGNSSSNWGGAIDLNVNLGTVTPTFDNATFTGNTSAVRRGGALSSEAYGTGGVANATLRNSILWGDVLNAGDPEIVFASNGAVTLDHSIVQGGCPSGNATCTNMVAGDPKLGALGNYGGAVLSVLPGGGSAAIDAGTCQLPDDVRGVPRPQGAGCDIGAVESRLSVLTVSVSGGGSVSASAAPLPVSGGIAACTASCSATYNGEALSTVTLTATPNAQQSFSAWSGDCSGTNPVTTVAMTAARTCTATFTQNLTQTTLVLSSGTNPSNYGTSLSFTATVAAVAPATQTPTGNVSFYDGTTLLGTQALNGAGTATFTTSTLSADTHSITAQYTGDTNYAAAAQPPSGALSQVVIAITPTLTWGTPSAIVYGTPLSAAQLNATATYNGNPVAGTFIYTPLAGSVLPAGNAQTLAVTFNPIDTTNYTSAAASVQINVTRAPLTVTGTNAQNKPYDGTATATLGGGTLVGVIPADASNVSLTQTGTFAQANVGTGIAVTANDSIGGSAAGNYTLTQPTGLSANITALTLTYKATAATIAYGTTPSGLSGTLSGFISGESQATATTGTLSFTTTATASSAPGSYPIDGSGLTANHGNYSFAQDAGNATALTISAAATSTTLTSSPTSAVYGQSVTFTATISLPSGNSGTAVGKVEFVEGANPLPAGCATAVTVSGGVATCTTQALSVGSHHVVATFTPSDGNTGVSAASTDVTVSAAATTTTITNAQPWTVALGASTTVNVTVTATAPGSGTPTGTVTVSNGGSGSGDHCTITLPATSCTLTPSSAGTKTVTATYTPDSASSTNFTGSNASASLSVSATQPVVALTSSANPSVFGQSVTLTGTLTPATGGVTPSGSVHFFIDGTTEICSNTTLSAVGATNAVSATCAVPQADLSVGDHPLRFQYDGDANNVASSATLVNGSQQTIPQTVNVAQTTTTVTAPASIVLGNPVTIGVSVSANAPGAGIPPGSVTVSLGGQTCSAVLDTSGAGNCVLTPPAPAGSKTITASYAGSSNFAASSGTASLQVSAVATTTTLVAPATAVYGQSVTFTATVSLPSGNPGTPAGTVAFSENGNPLPSGCATAVTVSGGVATCTTQGLAVSATTHHVIATFTPSDSNTTGSSGSTNVTVSAAATTTTITNAQPWTVSLGASTTVNVTVAATAPGSGTPTGTVTVSTGGSGSGDHCTITLPATNCALIPSSAGTKTVTATYTPDSASSTNFTGSNASASLSVSATQPVAALTSSANPSVFGQSVTLTGTLTPAAGGVTPSGSVHFFIDGTTEICANAALSAIGASNAVSATCVIPQADLSVGDHAVRFQYEGDANNTSSTATLVNGSQQTIPQTVNVAQTTTTVSAPASIVLGNPVTIGVSVSANAPGAGVPSGEVTVNVQGQICSVTLDSTGAGSCTLTPSAPAGNKTITANYAGSTNFAASSGTASLQVGSAATTTTLAAPATAVFGQSVTFTATVSLPSGNPGTPAGTVAFSENGNPLPSGCATAVTLTGGVATCTTQGLAVSATAHHVIATFTPSDNNTTGSSGSTNVTVSAAATTTTITNAQPWAVALGASTTVNVTVAATAPGSGTPTGTVTVSNGGSGSGDHCTITLPATSCTLTPSSAGTKTVTATYTPDSASSTNFTGSNASASLGVNASQPGTTLISSVNPSVFGQGVTLTGTVTPVAGGVTPTGKVQFFIDGETEICADSTLSATGTANSVNATCTVPQADLSVGDHALRFQYEGDANNTPSTATLLDGTQQTIPQTVHVAQTTTTVTAPASIVLGNPVTIGVSVSANAPGAGIPSGEVAVNVQGQICSVVLDSTGAGNCTLAPQAPAGSKTITASYVGSTNFAASSGTANLLVGAAATTTTLTASSATTVYGQSVTFTATVSAAEGIALNGTLAFRDGANVLTGCGAVPVASGSAQCTSTGLSVSAHTITATYTPTDANTAGSSATTGVTVGKAATITSLSAPASITLGNPVVVTATVAVGEPGAGTLSGSIAISDGDSGTGDHCTITLPATSCPLTPSSAGSKTLTAVYSPDTAASVNFTGS